MPFGAAAATTGGAANAAPEAPKEEMTDQKRAEREEFELNEEKVTVLELYSWYGKFFAKTVGWVMSINLLVLDYAGAF